MLGLNRQSSSSRSRKRATSDDLDIHPSVDQILETATKKMRISGSAGELSLARDIEREREDMGRSVDVIVRCGMFPTEALVDFKSVPAEQFCPNLFKVEIRRHYPHDAPVVRAVEEEYWAKRGCIDAHGVVRHPVLDTTWTALCSLKNVIELLRQVRESFREGFSPRHSPCIIAAPGTAGPMGVGVDGGFRSSPTAYAFHGQPYTLVESGAASFLEGNMSSIMGQEASDDMEVT